MKEKSFAGLMIFILILNFYITQVYGVIINVNEQPHEEAATTSRDENVLAYLKSHFGYDGTYIPKELKAKGKLKVKASDDPNFSISPTYDIFFYPDGVTNDYTKLNNTAVKQEDVINNFGCPGVGDNGLINASTAWDGIITVSITENRNVDTKDVVSYKIDINNLYTGDDLTKGETVEVDSSAFEGEVIEEIHEEQDNVMGFIMGVKQFIENFTHNKMGTIFTIILDGSIEKIDVIQKLANAFQTLPLKTVEDNQIVYEYRYLKKDGTVGNSGNNDPGAGNRNKYTNVSKGNENKGDESWQKIINIDISQTDFSSNGNYGFSNKTKIPVIVVDPYTIATSKISTFDVNFLVIDKDLHNPNDSIWIKIRNIWMLIIRITIYITSAILVSTLIIHGIILIVNNTMTPNRRRTHIEGLTNFAVSCGMLVSTILIMSCAIYASEIFLPNVMESNHTELPIRVNVAEAGYSFSTTQTGYVRYMAQIENVDLSGIKFLYVLAYLFLSLRNLIIASLLMIRTFLMFALAILGPIIVLFYSFNLTHLLPIDFRGWVMWYVSLASIQVILAFIYSFVSAI